MTQPVVPIDQLQIEPSLAGSRVISAAAAGDLQLMNCFECASCSYVCPSCIPLVQWMRVGKTELRNLQRKDS